MFSMGGVGCGTMVPLFYDLGPELAEAMRNRRREEFVCFPEFQSAETGERIADLTAEAPFWVARSARPRLQAPLALLE
jgi:hypothetical protein